LLEMETLKISLSKSYMFATASRKGLSSICGQKQPCPNQFLRSHMSGLPEFISRNPTFSGMMSNY
jgi:hypothetical protein